MVQYFMTQDGAPGADRLKKALDADDCVALQCKIRNSAHVMATGFGTKAA
jgi:hypothetical protein